MFKQHPQVLHKYTLMGSMAAWLSPKPCLLDGRPGQAGRAPAVGHRSMPVTRRLVRPTVADPSRELRNCRMAVCLRSSRGTMDVPVSCTARCDNSYMEVASGFAGDDVLLTIGEHKEAAVNKGAVGCREQRKQLSVRRRLISCYATASYLQWYHCF